MKEKAVIMDSQAIERALKRIAHEIIEKNGGVENAAFIGIQRRGVPLSKRIASYVEEFEGVMLPAGILDITFYRDDLSLLASHPILNGTEIDFDLNNKTIIMVDDVLYTGRTARAAMDAIMDMGRPKYIQFAVLIDRGHRELPIRADYIGKNVPTSRTETVQVMVSEIDGENKVVIYEKQPIFEG